jgi:hypothetical protein
MRRAVRLPILQRMRVTALLAACVAALTVLASATASTPAGYRAHVNAICAPYTPTVKQLSRQLAAAEQAKDGHAYGVALGKLIVLQLTEDRKVEAVPVPAALKVQMTRILTRLKLLDGHLRKSLTDAMAGDNAGMLAELKLVSQLGKPVNGWLDAAGLRECGTKQT